MKKILYIIVLITFIFFIDKIHAYTEYKIGDEITYNDIKFYVIKNSSSDEDTVTMLKAEPLSYLEVQHYSEGTNAQITNQNGYGGIQYHSTSNEYEGSYVKTTVDAWAQVQAPLAIEARLITFDELTSDLGYEYYEESSNSGYRKTESTPSWVYNNNYWYWTMSPYSDSTDKVWYPSELSEIMNYSPVNCGRYGFGISDGKIRPVITLSKTALGDTDESIIDDKTIEKDISNKPNESKTTVKVDNTYMSSSILLIILGFITASVSVIIIYKLCNKKR